MPSLFRSHLFWFVVLGTLLAAAEYARRSPDTMVVDAALVDSLSARWTAEAGAPPSEEQLAALVDEWIVEELLFREAIRLGLDRNDEIIRRRLVQKMGFLAEETAVIEPTDGVLRTYYDDSVQEYRSAPVLSFNQVVFRSLDSADMSAIRERLKTGRWHELGDASMLNGVYLNQTSVRLASEFGEAFVAGLLTAVDNHITAAWLGPIESVHGQHFVQVIGFQPGSAPPFEDIRDQVLTDYLDQTRRQARTGLAESLRAKTQVVREDLRQ